MNKIRRLEKESYVVAMTCCVPFLFMALRKAQRMGRLQKLVQKFTVIAK